jgi:hypothetical protein
VSLLSFARIERDLFREEAQAVTDRLNAFKLEMGRAEADLSGQLEEARRRCRSTELAAAEALSKHARTETELRTRENVSRRKIVGLAQPKNALVTPPRPPPKKMETSANVASAFLFNI